MNGKMTLVTLALAGLMLAGCGTTTYPLAGMWTQDVIVSVDGNMPSGGKRGKACATTYAGVYAFGDASVKEAAKDGGITRVEAVEAEINSRIVIGTYCTIVHGR